MIDDETLRKQIEEHLETAEDYIRQGARHRALMEFEKAAATLEAAGKNDQLEQLWAHAATGFTAAQAVFEAGHSYLRLAHIEKTAGRKQDARDSFLAAANAFIAVRDKTRDVWRTILQAVEEAVEFTIALNEPGTAIELLVKAAMIHFREMGYTVDAINCLERAQQLLGQVPDHPLAEEINEQLQFLIDHEKS